MRILRIALPLLLISASAACASNRGSAASEALPPSATGEVMLLNRDEIVRLMTARYTPQMRRTNRDGFVVLELTLDRTGSVSESRYKTSGGGVTVFNVAQGLATRLRFSPPAAAGERVLVRLSYDRTGRPDVFLEQ
jgi:hypothetical protein